MATDWQPSSDCGVFSQHMKTHLHILLNHIVNNAGYVLVRKEARFDRDALEAGRALFANQHSELRKVHYGCGRTPLLGWLNVDYIVESQFRREFGNEFSYVCANLASLTPFPSNFFQFGFSQDFLEHLDQKDALTFLSECYRCFAVGGVLRLSFPSLEGVLNQHYRSHSGEGALAGGREAYSAWGHRHFFSRAGLATVARHIGFREVLFVNHGESKHAELCGLDTRNNQIGMNTYVELTK